MFYFILIAWLIVLIGGQSVRDTKIISKRWFLLVHGSVSDIVYCGPQWGWSLQFKYLFIYSFAFVSTKFRIVLTVQQLHPATELNFTLQSELVKKKLWVNRKIYSICLDKICLCRIYEYISKHKQLARTVLGTHLSHI